MPFYFYEIAMAADGFGFNDSKRIGRIMMKGSLQRILAIIATAANGFGFNNDERIGGIMMKGSLQGILAMRCELFLRAGIHWRHAGIHWVLESGVVSVGDAPVSIGYQNLEREGDFC